MATDYCWSTYQIDLNGSNRLRFNVLVTPAFTSTLSKHAHNDDPCFREMFHILVRRASSLRYDGVDTKQGHETILFSYCMHFWLLLPSSRVCSARSPRQWSHQTSSIRCWYCGRLKQWLRSYCHLHMTAQPTDVSGPHKWTTKGVLPCTP